jgi:hypothetical protein
VTAPSPGRGDDKPVGDLVNEFAGLVVGYVKQETFNPIKALGRYLGYGVVGSILVSIGGIMLALTTVRLLQAETGASLTGSLTWVPYIGGIVVAGGGAALAVSRITKVRR